MIDLSQQTPRIAFDVLSSAILRIRWGDFRANAIDNDEVAATRLSCTDDCLKAGSFNTGRISEAWGGRQDEGMRTTTVQPEDNPLRLAHRLACNVDDLQLMYGDCVKRIRIQLSWPPGHLRTSQPGAQWSLEEGRGTGTWLRGSDVAGMSSHDLKATDL